MPRCPNPLCRADYAPGTTQCTNLLCKCLLPGTVVAGRYRVETLIGIGGMGAVYRVSDTFEMVQAALKVLTVTNVLADMPTAVERFRREARYAHQLHHKNIVPVLNFGQDGSLLYLVMPLVTGGTLKSLLKAEHPLPTQKAQQFLTELADAIDAIHAHPQQIVHRDIKPSNLLIHQDDGRLVVADFGIARAMQQEKALTQRGWAVGTEHYLAPEQEEGQPETSSDIYSMGVVAYQMFTGLLPFQALIKSADITPGLPGPSSINPALPPALDAVIFRALEVDPNKRFPSARTFADAVNDALSPQKTAEPDVSEIEAVDTINMDNVVMRTVIPENPCSACGRENRSTSRFCRYCGHTLDDPSPLMVDTYQIGYMTDAGFHATENEDMLLIVQGLCMNLQPPVRPFSLFAIADGLRDPQGKLAKGREASKLAIETIADTLLPFLVETTHTLSRHTPHTPQHTNGQAHITSQMVRRKLPIPPSDAILERWVRDAMHQANQVLYHCNSDYDTHMASTLTVALLYKHHLYVGSVGDSRAYHYNTNQGLRCITTDHTVATNLVAAHLLQPQDVYTSPERDNHYRSLGQNYQIPIDLFQHEVEAGDLILLCTDGLWHNVRDERIEEIVAQGGDPQKLAQTLINAAKNAGGDGNASVIVANIQ